jgi:hypothetical protein
LRALQRPKPPPLQSAGRDYWIRYRSLSSIRWRLLSIEFLLVLEGRPGRRRPLAPCGPALANQKVAAAGARLRFHGRFRCHRVRCSPTSVKKGARARTAREDQVMSMQWSASHNSFSRKEIKKKLLQTFPVRTEGLRRRHGREREGSEGGSYTWTVEGSRRSLTWLARIESDRGGIVVARTKRGEKSCPLPAAASLHHQSSSIVAGRQAGSRILARHRAGPPGAGPGRPAERLYMRRR